MLSSCEVSEDADFGKSCFGADRKWRMILRRTWRGGVLPAVIVVVWCVSVLCCSQSLYVGSVVGIYWEESERDIDEPSDFQI